MSVAEKIYTECLDDMPLQHRITCAANSKCVFHQLVYSFKTEQHSFTSIHVRAGPQLILLSAMAESRER